MDRTNNIHYFVILRKYTQTNLIIWKESSIYSRTFVKFTWNPRQMEENFNWKHQTVSITVQATSVTSDHFTLRSKLISDSMSLIQTSKFA